MPGGDRTGPRGSGSMTGRSFGYCAGYETPGYTKGSGMWLGRVGWRGRGGGYGRGFGFDRNWDWGYGFRKPIYHPVYTTYPIDTSPIITPENQIIMLKQEKEYLELEMNGIKTAVENISKRIEELEKKE